VLILEGVVPIDVFLYKLKHKDTHIESQASQFMYSIFISVFNYPVNVLVLTMFSCSKISLCTLVCIELTFFCPAPLCLLYFEFYYASKYNSFVILKLYTFL